jgi:hypothetical protein
VATTNLQKKNTFVLFAVQFNEKNVAIWKKGGFDEECQPIREEEEISEVSKRFFTANKKKQKSAIMEEEVQALVVDNGSGMCKAGE